MTGYEWRKIGDDPQRFELIDTHLNIPIGMIFQAGRLWSWYRKTSILTHGVSPEQGAADSLRAAKAAAEKGLS